MYELLHTMRAHGWDRGLGNKKNNSFNFINSGFNVRPLDLTAAIGLSQFKRLKKIKNIRTYNRKKIIQSIQKSPEWKNQLNFLQPTKNLKASWFGLPILINKKFLKNKKKYLNYLSKKGIENRPILSGNFLNQPCIKLYGLSRKKNEFKKAEEIEKRGFFIGLHNEKISPKEVKLLTKNLLKVDVI